MLVEQAEGCAPEDVGVEPLLSALDLAPLNWATTAVTQEVAAKLAANRFR